MDQVDEIHKQNEILDGDGQSEILEVTLFQYFVSQMMIPAVFITIPIFSVIALSVGALYDHTLTLIPPEVVENVYFGLMVLFLSTIFFLITIRFLFSRFFRIGNYYERFSGSFAQVFHNADSKMRGKSVLWNVMFVTSFRSTRILIFSLVAFWLLLVSFKSLGAIISPQFFQHYLVLSIFSSYAVEISLLLFMAAFLLIISSYICRLVMSSDRSNFNEYLRGQSEIYLDKVLGEGIAIVAGLIPLASFVLQAVVLSIFYFSDLYLQLEKNINIGLLLGGAVFLLIKLDYSAKNRK